MMRMMIPRCDRTLAAGLVALLSVGCFFSSTAAAGSNELDDGSRHLSSGVPSLKFTCQSESMDCYDMGNNNFQLTEDETFNSRSAIWANTKVHLEDSFVMQAQILIDSPTFVGGEGLALVFQTKGADALGSAGPGKGYEGINPCVAVEINTHPTGSADTSDTKISITKNSPSNIFPEIGSAGLGYIKDLRIRELRVKYDGPNKHITVNFDGNEILSGPLDLIQELGGQTDVTWGFTASSAGSLSSDQWVNFEKFDYLPSTTPAAVVVTPPQQPPAPPSPKVFLQENFNQPTQTPWVFHSNEFRGTYADEKYISGEESHTKYGGWHGSQSTGGLRLRLTSGCNEDVSGGWETTLVLTEGVRSMTLAFGYIATLEEGFFSNEQTMVLAEVDGIGTVVETIQGGEPYHGHWGKAKVDLGSFAPGSYKIKIGGFLKAPTSQGKVFQIRIDNVSITGLKDTM